LEQNENLIFSSADGKVVAIEEVMETEYFNEKRLQVSVFMSVVNVHVNWYPITGKLMYNHHKPGRFYPAYLPKSSEENERNSIVVKDKKGREVMVRQIAGLLARRIIAKDKPGIDVKQGNELGMIKFGSRVDFFLPLNAKVQVKIGDIVRGNKTLVAKFE
jgi:phosphatidylserine decarboxylase